MTTILDQTSRDFFQEQAQAVKDSLFSNSRLYHDNFLGVAGLKHPQYYALSGQLGGDAASTNIEDPAAMGFAIVNGASEGVDYALEMAIKNGATLSDAETIIDWLLACSDGQGFFRQTPEGRYEVDGYLISENGAPRLPEKVFTFGSGTSSTAITELGSAVTNLCVKGSPCKLVSDTTSAMYYLGIDGSSNVTLHNSFSDATGGTNPVDPSGLGTNATTGFLYAGNLLKVNARSGNTLQMAQAYTDVPNSAVNNAGGYTAGATTITVDDGSVFTEREIINIGVSQNHRITGISSNDITITPGLRYDVADNDIVVQGVATTGMAMLKSGAKSSSAKNFRVNQAGGYTVNPDTDITTIVIDNVTNGDPANGDTFNFNDHGVEYTVSAYDSGTGELTFSPALIGDLDDNALCWQLGDEPTNLNRNTLYWYKITSFSTTLAMEFYPTAADMKAGTNVITLSDAGTDAWIARPGAWAQKNPQYAGALDGTLGTLYALSLYANRADADTSRGSELNKLISDVLTHVMRDSTHPHFKEDAADQTGRVYLGLPGAPDTSALDTTDTKSAHYIMNWALWPLLPKLENSHESNPITALDTTANTVTLKYPLPYNTPCILKAANALRPGSGGSLPTGLSNGTYYLAYRLDNGREEIYLYPEGKYFNAANGNSTDRISLSGSYTAGAGFEIYGLDRYAEFQCMVRDGMLQHYDQVAEGARLTPAGLPFGDFITINRDDGSLSVVQDNAKESYYGAFRVIANNLLELATAPELKEKATQSIKDYARVYFDHWQATGHIPEEFDKTTNGDPVYFTNQSVLSDNHKGLYYATLGGLAICAYLKVAEGDRAMLDAYKLCVEPLWDSAGGYYNGIDRVKDGFVLSIIWRTLYGLSLKV